MNIIAEQLDINQKLVYYSARKTFAHFASELGIPDNVIDNCLGHSDKSKGVTVLHAGKTETSGNSY